MKKKNLNKRLFLNKKILSNLSGIQGGNIATGTPCINTSVGADINSNCTCATIDANRKTNCACPTHPACITVPA